MRLKRPAFSMRCAVPIRPFLRDQAFEPDMIEIMSAAFQVACEHLNLRTGVDDPATRLVAAKIIELAQRGVRDLEALAARAIDEFR